MCQLYALFFFSLGSLSGQLIIGLLLDGCLSGSLFPSVIWKKFHSSELQNWLAFFPSLCIVSTIVSHKFTITLSITWRTYLSSVVFLWFGFSYKFHILVALWPCHVTQGMGALFHNLLLITVMPWLEPTHCASCIPMELEMLLVSWLGSATSLIHIDKHIRGINMRCQRRNCSRAKAKNVCQANIYGITVLVEERN